MKTEIYCSVFKIENINFIFLQIVRILSLESDIYRCQSQQKHRSRMKAATTASEIELSCPRLAYYYFQQNHRKHAMKRGIKV